MLLQQSLKYCLIKHLNTEEGYADMFIIHHLKIIKWI